MKFSYGINKFMRLFGGKNTSSKQILNIDNLDGATDQVETEEYRFKNRTVLVGVVRNVNQFNVLLKKKFYHIPVSQLSGCQFPVKCIAIYQSKHLFGKSSGIKIYGEVESCETVLRKNIVEIPKNSDEKYMYFKVKKWCRLRNPIKANDMDLTAFSTTPYLLKASSYSAELQFRSQQEADFCNMLIKKVKKCAKLPLAQYEDTVYKDFILKFKEGVIYCYFGDVFQSGISYEKYLERPTDLVRDIFDYYPEES